MFQLCELDEEVDPDLLWQLQTMDKQVNLGHDVLKKKENCWQNVYKKTFHYWVYSILLKHSILDDHDLTRFSVRELL